MSDSGYSIPSAAAAASARWPRRSGCTSGTRRPRLPKSTKADKFDKYTEKIPDSDVSFDMVPIPGGTFLMGSPASEKGRNADEGPQHPVTLKPFWMGKCEVTWDEYDLFSQGDGPRSTDEDFDEDSQERPPTPSPGRRRPTPTRPSATAASGYPVALHHHHAAMEYCRWLSVKTGKTLSPADRGRVGVRLPRRHQDGLLLRRRSEEAGRLRLVRRTTAKDDTHQVGTKKPNPWGLYDMYGNVAEWCLDHYKKDYYAKFPADKPTLWPVQPADGRSLLARGPRRLVGRQGEGLPQRRAPRLGQDLDQARSAAAAEHLVADRRRFRRLPRRAAGRGKQALKGLKSKVTRQSKNGP